VSFAERYEGGDTPVRRFRFTFHRRVLT